MNKVIVKGEATAFDKDYNPITGEDLKKLDGVDCGDCFTDYMDVRRVSARNDLSGGYMHFEYKDGKLWTITEYEAKRVLNDQELEELQGYTQGQWSDGIGEGFEQHPCNSDEDYISPWFHGQELKTWNNIAEVREKKINELGIK